jgi:predicted amidohydrolase
MSVLKAAVVQLCSSPDVASNLSRVAALCERAKSRGAELVVLPENFALLSPDEREKFSWAVRIESSDGGLRGSGKILDEMRALAERLGIHLVLGGLPEAGRTSERVFNSSVHLFPDGGIAAVYRKIHLFDVHFAHANTSLRESSSVEYGDVDQAIVSATPWGGLGLSVCYDVRFPELYRRLVAAGAQLLSIPAAFTLHTGKDHWHVLLRARAIENQCFVLAAAQQGRHSPTRFTYGHSLIVDPWGTVLCEVPDGEGVAVAELDFASLQKIRTDLPALAHRRIGVES